MPDVDAREQRWTLSGDHNGRGIDHVNADGPLLDEGEKFEVVPASRLAEVERERDRLAIEVEEADAELSRTTVSLTGARDRARSDAVANELARRVEAERAADVRRERDRLEVERDEARAALDRAREALREIASGSVPDGCLRVHVGPTVAAFARAALDALPKREETRDGAHTTQR